MLPWHMLGVFIQLWVRPISKHYQEACHSLLFFCYSLLSVLAAALTFQCVILCLWALSVMISHCYPELRLPDRVCAWEAMCKQLKSTWNHMAPTLYYIMTQLFIADKYLFLICLQSFHCYIFSLITEPKISAFIET